jgi:putative ABC transport system permease protein
LRSVLSRQPFQKLVIGQGLRLSAAAHCNRIYCGGWIAHIMESMLVGITATDPRTFAAMILVFFLVAAVASWFPARQAATLDPTVALREE